MSVDLPFFKFKRDDKGGSLVSGGVFNFSFMGINEFFNIPNPNPIPLVLVVNFGSNTFDWMVLEYLFHYQQRNFDIFSFFDGDFYFGRCPCLTA